MAVQTLFGWGGVKIGTGEFTTAFGTIAFIPEYVRNTTIAGKHILHPKGWRVSIDAELFNDGSDAQIALFTGLASTLSQAFTNGSSIAIYPRYTSTDTGSTAAYLCFLDSDFAPEDWANVNVGQSLKLKFIGEELLTGLPTSFSNQAPTDAIDDAGNTIIDDSGNQIIYL